MMSNDRLSGIERDLVIQYMIDENVPVTLTPSDDNIEYEGIIHSLTSQVLPVVLKGEQVNVKKDGTVILVSPPVSVINFTGRIVKTEFYFNRVGLYFYSPVTETEEGLSLVIPEHIDRILDHYEDSQYDFSALIYFNCKTRQDADFKCIPYKGIELFTRPAWGTISSEKQQEAKVLLEQFVKTAKAEKNAGNGLHLIPVCKYLTDEVMPSMEAMEGRKKPFSILFVDHERLIVGMENSSCTFFRNDEYGIKLFLSIDKGPISTRDIFVTCVVNNIYRNENLVCVDFKYSSIQEEDLRFLYEKATSLLFI